ncbi:lon protease [Anaeramoeba flamelloides]|uniref:Lon protease homolog n=1 Tax=Anaeramoeba flamelloides TaxID=1746091 RepID=A0ABQ8ZAB4_9EUKA|nr:lon protease [Anaeramoeba flamelloides]
MLSSLLNKTFQTSIVQKNYCIYSGFGNLVHKCQARSFQNHQISKTNLGFVTNNYSIKRYFTQSPEIQHFINIQDRYSILEEEKTNNKQNEEKDIFPMEVPLIPLFFRPLFPGVSIRTLLPHNEVYKYKKAAFFFIKDLHLKTDLEQINESIQKALQPKKSIKQIFSGFFNNEQNEEDIIKNFSNVGTLAQINSRSIHFSPRSHPSCIGLQRIKALKVIPNKKIFLIKVDTIDGSNGFSGEDYNNNSNNHHNHSNGNTNGSSNSNGNNNNNILNSENIKLYQSKIFSLLQELSTKNPFFQTNLEYLIKNMKKIPLHSLLDLSCSMTTSRGTVLQDILDTIPLNIRFSKVEKLLQDEIKICERRQSIMKRVSAQLSEQQKKIYLEKQMKEIKSELGIEGRGNWDIIKKLRNEMEGKKYPEHAKEAIEEQFEKLSQLNVSSLEFNTTRNYLDWLIRLPWCSFKKENLDISLAKKILDEDHYGLHDVKRRILEFIAVGNLRGSLHGKILCLVGPPGTGKTSIGKSLSRALDREFFRYSLGGLSDTSALKGFKRTYIGALPGLFIQGMKNLKTSNPVFVLDEIDKLGVSHKGDPSSALLEALDPEQNSEFLDHYLDVSYDLSKVLFVMTANVTSTIPSPLLDRMEVIRISGYVEEEKLQIAKKYLIPKVRKETGIKENQVEITESAIRSLIRDYCREAGVRNLEKNLEKIHRKVAYQIAISKSNSSDNMDVNTTSQKQQEGAKDVKQQEEKQQQQKQTQLLKNKKIIVDEKDLQEYLGKAIFLGDRIFKKTGVGVVAGLAWSNFGGALSYIESIKTEFDEFDEINESNQKNKKKKKRKIKKRGSHQITGQLGEVMKESSQIAYTFSKKFLRQIQPNNNFLEQSCIHTHCPEGAIPKDGPSAGVTMVSSLISLALQKPVKEDFAMTGEITLSGKVLPVGGIKEKVLAARRSGIKQLIFPKENQRDWFELEDYITNGITPHFVQKYEDIYKIIFE